MISFLFTRKNLECQLSLPLLKSEDWPCRDLNKILKYVLRNLETLDGRCICYKIPAVSNSVDGHTLKSFALFWPVKANTKVNVVKCNVLPVVFLYADHVR